MVGRHRPRRPIARKSPLFHNTLFPGGKRPGVDHLTDQARDLTTNASSDLTKLLINTLSEDDILERLVGSNFEKFKDLPEKARAQILIRYPKARKSIPIGPLHADYRTIILSEYPEDEDLLHQFDVNAKDLKRKHYGHLIQSENKSLMRFLNKNISDENIKKFRTPEWVLLLRKVPHAAKRLDIKSIRNSTELRQLVSSRPSILKYHSLEDMKNSVLDAPSWVRIIGKMQKNQRKHVPAGFTEWAEREIFRKSLSGRRFKPFKKGWKEGLIDENV